MVTRKRATWSGSARGRTGEVASQSQTGKETEKVGRGRTKHDAERKCGHCARVVNVSLL